MYTQPQRSTSLARRQSERSLRQPVLDKADSEACLALMIPSNGVTQRNGALSWLELELAYKRRAGELELEELEEVISGHK
jgi:hypothetical protein